MEDVATRIELCGRLAVCWEGEAIEGALRGRQGRLLFAYLVLNRGHALRRDQLVEAVWPGETSAAGVEQHLAPLLSRLRRLIGPQWLQGRSELTLLLPDDAYVDWEVLHAGVERARAAALSGDGEAAVTAARSALELAGRELLPGLEAPWIDERRLELADVRVEALELVARTGIGLGGPHLLAAERAARDAVEAAPFRESVRGAAMEVLRAQGNVAEALRVYEDLRGLLREELGTTPGPELVALHRRLLTDLDRAPAPDPSPGRAPAARPASRVAHGRPALPDLVERERELAELAALLAEAEAGEGRVAMIEGPAGVGKTRLLAEARRRAETDGTVMLNARAGEVEREFPFGVVRQLFEGQLADPARRETLLAGAAAPAAVVFGDGGDGLTETADTSFAVLHGLFWLVLNLAAERPLLLAVDDVHWADRPSLRFLAYLVRRLEGVPVLVAATLRTGERPTDPALLDELLHDPATIPVRPGPLSAGAVRVVVRARLGAEAADAFCEACHLTTAGNPLLLRQLLTVLEADGVRPDAEGVAAVREIGPRAVSRTIGLRLARMSAGTVAVARAIAVLGERAELATVTALAGLEESSAASAIAALARAEVLRSERPLGFVHPLVRDAVYRELAPGERELHHARAARVLADAGADDDIVAVHLLAAPCRGDARVVDVLRRAGASAARQGAPENAIALLSRALEEPPSPEIRPNLLLEIGQIEKLVDGLAASGHLQRAYAELTDPRDRAAAALSLVWTLYFVGSPPETAAFALQAADDLPDEFEDLRRGLDALVMITTLAHGVALPSFEERMRELRDTGGPVGDGPGTKMQLACFAWASAVTGGRAEECAPIALRALEGNQLLKADDGLTLVAAATVLVLADRPEAQGVWDRALAEAHRRGSMFLVLTVHVWRGWTLLARGELAEAERSILEGYEQMVRWGSGSAMMGYPAAFLSSARLEQGDLVGAREAIGLGGRPRDGGDAGRFLLSAHAEVLLAEGRPEEAVGLVERAARVAARHPNAAWAPWRGLMARCLQAVGRPEEALRYAEEELAAARTWGAPSIIGRALRVIGTMTGGEAGIERLREAIALLDPTPARLERAKAHAALGTRLLAAGGDPEAEAHTVLQHALDLAQACGAAALAESIVLELQSAGIAPRTAGLAGAGVLTEFERRAATLAAEGLDARAIAQTLFATPRTVEERLASARRKLGAQDAAELGRALAGSPG